MGLRGLSRLTCVCVFLGDLSTPIRVFLIVVPDTIGLPSNYEALYNRGRPSNQ